MSVIGPDRTVGRVAAALSWVPGEVLSAWVPGATPPDALATIAQDARLDLCFVDSSTVWAGRAVETLGSRDVTAAWAVSGVLGRIAERLGWVEALRLTAAEPGSVAFEIDRALHEALVDVRAGLAAGAEAFVIADDLAGAAGWLVAPDFALEVLVPGYRRLTAEAGDAEVIFHSDGDVRALFPALAVSGFSAVHLGGGAARLDAAVAAADAADLRLLGGVPAAGAESQASAIVRDVVGHALHGSLVICDDGAIQTAEELRACLDVIAMARESAGLTSEGEAE